MKIPICFSIEDNLDEWISAHAQELGFRNKSHLVEEAIKEFRKRKEDEKK